MCSGARRGKLGRKVLKTDFVGTVPMHLQEQMTLESNRTDKDWGLRSADCGMWTTDSGPHLREKTLLPQIVIFQRFLKFAIGKKEMSYSSSLPLTRPCYEAWPLRG